MAVPMIYPFGRFNADAKRALTLSQEEGQRARQSYIGTEHLLLGLLRVEAGTACKILTKLGLSLEQVRKEVESVVGRNEHPIIQAITLTPRVKKVIEISFEEARNMDWGDVDTGHMLMALVIEGGGIAAYVLDDLGATYELVITAVQRELGASLAPRPRLQDRPIVSDASWLIGRRAHLRTPVEDLARVLNSPPIAKQLKARGLDADSLLKQLSEPPAKVKVLRAALVTAQSALETTLRAQQLGRATDLEEEIDRLFDQVVQAEQEWLDSLP